MKRPFENRALLDTRNRLSLTASSNQYVQIPEGNVTFERKDGEKISISFLVAVDNPNVSQVIFAKGVPSEPDKGIHVEVNGAGNFLFYVASPGGYNQSAAWPVVANRTYRITLELISSGFESTFRVYVNTRKAHEMTTNYGGLVGWALTNDIFLGVDNNEVAKRYFSGQISSLVILQGKEVSRSELNDLHHTNVIPKSLHPYVVAHYPLNENFGSIAFDEVARYNYAKTTALAPYHGILTNFSSKEIGSENQLLQTAWQNIFKKKKVGEFSVKLNGTNSYIEKVLNHSLPSWTLFMRFNSGSGTTSEYFFTNKLHSPGTGGSATDLIIIRKVGNDLHFYIGAESPAVYILSVAPNKYYSVLMTSNGATVNITVVDSAGNRSLSGGFGIAITNFERLIFSAAVNYSVYYSTEITHFVLLDRVASEREKNALLNAVSSDEYTKASRFIDLDFGDVFHDTDYFIRDNSGNNRHAKLINFDPATDQPLKVFRNNGLPERKALRLINSSSHHLRISGFNPTKEKGYTYIVGYKADFNTATGNPALVFKRGSNVKGIFFSNTLSEVNHFINNLQGTEGDPKTNSALNFIAATENSNTARFFIGNAKVQDHVSGSFTPLGFDEVGSSDLTIGFDNGHYFGGYLTHLSIFKGTLKQREIIDIMRGNATPQQMTDCQLYLNFEEIRRSKVIFSVDNITSGFSLSTGNGIMTYGSDSDGNYVEFEYNGISTSATTARGSVTPNRAYKGKIKYKIIQGTKATIGLIGGPHVIQPTNVGVLTELETASTIGYGENVGLRISFDAGTGPVIGDKIRVYAATVEHTLKWEIKDWSPQNRVVVLNNYTDNEVNPAHLDYKITRVNNIIEPSEKLFIDALSTAGISLTATEQKAITRLVWDLKDAGIWARARAIYPFVGGVANGFKFNLKDPRDLDAAFRLVFNGGWTHATTGSTPDGSTGYAQTFFKEDTHLTNPDTLGSHLSAYIRTNSSAGTKTSIGAFGSVGASFIRERNGSDEMEIFNGTTAGLTGGTESNSDARGLFINSRINLKVSGFKGATKLINATSSGDNPASFEHYLGALNVNGSAGQFGDREIAFASVGSGLTDSECVRLSQIVDFFQTHLGRNI